MFGDSKTDISKEHSNSIFGAITILSAVPVGLCYEKVEELTDYRRVFSCFC